MVKAGFAAGFECLTGRCENRLFCLEKCRKAVDSVCGQTEITFEDGELFIIASESELASKVHVLAMAMLRLTG